MKPFTSTKAEVKQAFCCDVQQEYVKICFIVVKGTAYEIYPSCSRRLDRWEGSQKTQLVSYIKDVYSKTRSKTTCFGLIWPSSGFFFFPEGFAI